MVNTSSATTSVRRHSPAGPGHRVATDEVGDEHRRLERLVTPRKATLNGNRRRQTNRSGNQITATPTNVRVAISTPPRRASHIDRLFSGSRSAR